MKKKYLLTALIGLSLLSCSRELDVKEAFPFEFTSMPYRTEIHKGQKVEIRCELKTKGSNKDARYKMRFFQYTGEGELRQFFPSEEVMKPNDYYPIGLGKFSMWYTSLSEKEQSLEIVIEDQYAQKKSLRLNFSNNGTLVKEESIQQQKKNKKLLLKKIEQKKIDNQIKRLKKKLEETTDKDKKDELLLEIELLELQDEELELEIKTLEKEQIDDSSTSENSSNSSDEDLTKINTKELIDQFNKNKEELKELEEVLKKLSLELDNP